MARLRFDPLRVDQAVALQAAEDGVDRSLGERQIRVVVEPPDDVEPVKPFLPETGEDRELQPALADLRFPVVGWSGGRVWLHRINIYVVLLGMFRVSPCPADPGQP